MVSSSERPAIAAETVSCPGPLHSSLRLDTSSLTARAATESEICCRIAHAGVTEAGVTVYAESANVCYQIAGRGKSADLSLVLTSGQ